MERRRLRCQEYNVGWVCALPVELAAAQELLDEVHQDPCRNDRDTNLYTLGRIGEHNIVIACLPAGQLPYNSAATVAVQMKSAFPSIRFGLMVGIGGGVPSEEADIRLGDVVVSQPHKGHGGVVQYDFGKATASKFERICFLDVPPTILLNAISKLKAKSFRGISMFSEHLSKLTDLPLFARSSAGPDILFEATYEHTGGPTCETCSKERAVHRQPRCNQEIMVHYGTIASGNHVMRDGLTRDMISLEFGGVLCFEMEAAGLTSTFPCLVIRGICDYADSHKNKRWQAYAAGTAAAYAKEVLSVMKAAEVAVMPNRDVNTEETFSISFDLSGVSETECFVARQQELAEIHKKLGGDGSHRTVVLHGLGGIGKTQLAVAYARRHRADYSAIFWLDSKDEDSLKQSFARVSRRVLQELPFASWLSAVEEKGNLDEVVDAVKMWLSHPKNRLWLVVYDRYDNPKLPGSADRTAFDISRFLPEAHQGAILITTRSSQVKIGHLIRVGKLVEVRDSLEILSHASGRECVADGELYFGDHRCRVDIFTDHNVVELAKELDGLPLALATAGAYLRQVATSFADYLRLYKSSWLKLQQMTPKLSSYQDHAIYSTWQLSFERIKRQNDLSARLLQLWAYFDNQSIWFELLRHSNSSVPGWFSQLIEDELSFNQAIKALCGHGLAELDTSPEETESRAYSMHSCVHSWTIHVLNQEWDFGMARLALECVGSYVPDVIARKSEVTQRRLLRHAARCWQFVVDGMVSEDGVAWVLGSLGNLHSDQGKLGEAEKMYKRALQGKEKALGPEHTSTLVTVNNLGSLYAKQGRLDEAEKMYKHAFEGLEKALGPEHMSTLTTVNSLGRLYAKQSRLEEAEKMFQRALQGYENTLGLEHTSTLDTVGHIGNLYVDQSKLGEAEKMYQRALQGCESVLGPEHTSTLVTVNNLGSLYVKQSRLNEAEKMYIHALEGFEKALGPEHTLTLVTVNNLGSLYAKQGKLNEAEKMNQRAMQRREKAFEPARTSTLYKVNFALLNPLNDGTALPEDVLRDAENSPLFKAKLVCNVANCGKSFTKMAGLKRHMASVHSASKIECPVPLCNRSGANGFSRKDYLTQHIRKVHQENGVPPLPGVASLTSSIPSKRGRDDELPLVKRSNGTPTAVLAPPEDIRRDGTDDPKKFACPFYQHNQWKYYGCVGLVFSMSRLKEHIFRRHMLQCRRCRTIFDECAYPNGHLKCCTCGSVPVEPVEGITKQQYERLLQSTGRGIKISEAQQWKMIYQICFPNDLATPSPYMDFDFGGMKKVAKFTEYLQSQLPRRIYENIKANISPKQDSLLDLRSIIPDIIQNCVSQAIDEVSKMSVVYAAKGQHSDSASIELFNVSQGDGYAAIASTTPSSSTGSVVESTAMLSADCLANMFFHGNFPIIGDEPWPPQSAIQMEDDCVGSFGDLVGSPANEPL